MRYIVAWALSSPQHVLRENSKATAVEFHKTTAQTVIFRLSPRADRRSNLAYDRLAGLGRNRSRGIGACWNSKASFLGRCPIPYECSEQDSFWKKAVCRLRRSQPCLITPPSTILLALSGDLSGLLLLSIAPWMSFELRGWFGRRVQRVDATLHSF